MTTIEQLTPEETKALIQLFKTCDSTLKKCDEAQKEKDQIIKAQQDAIDSQAKSISELKQSKDGIIESKTLWFALGGLFTGVLVFLVKHQ